MMSVVALPMYDWPEVREAVDAQWAALLERLGSAGVAAPEQLTRRNADLPAVPGGIPDRDGRVIASNPCALPPDGLDFHTLWKHPDLLLAQTCWGPMELGLAEHVVVVGQASYDGIEGGEGEHYSSVILMRGRDEGVDAPANGSAVLPMALLHGARLAFNETGSRSGYLALARDIEAAGGGMEIFSGQIETGAHRASIVAVAEGKADVCAIDCRSWQLARSHEPHACELRAVGWTAHRKGLPYITSRHTPPDVVSKLRRVLAQ